MVSRPAGTNAFEFVIVAALRTHQLMAGCLPRVPGSHKATTLAQMEVAADQVSSVVPEAAGPQ